jgi:hypothetical protein
MSGDGKFEKSQEDVRDTVAEETKEDVRENLVEEKYFTDQAKKLREKAAQIVEGDEHIEFETPSIKGESPRIKGKSYINSINPAASKKGREILNMMGRKPIVTLLIIGAIVLVGILLYALVQYGNQSEKEEKFNASWNQSLDSLRSGNVSVTQYCNKDPHDQKLCDLFWKLKYM